MSDLSLTRTRPSAENLGENALRVSHLTVRLDGRAVLQDVSFDVKRGTTLAVLGPNGAGKTVLLRTLLGLVPHDGTITWREGTKIGYVPQHLFVADVPITVREFLGIKKGIDLRESLASVGLIPDSILDERLGTLSGGELQRVLIAWAIADRPDVLLFDEPLSNVDLGGEDLILETLNRIEKAFGLAAVGATWYLDRSTRLPLDAVIGVMFVFALAVGLLLTPEPDLLEALFGDIANVSWLDAALAVLISTGVIVAARAIYSGVILSHISEELAVSAKIRVGRVTFLYLLLVALVVATGIKVVGTLLVGALVILPAAAARNVSGSLHRYGLLSALFGTVSSVAGISLANVTGLPPGPLVVLVGSGFFLGSIIARRVAAPARHSPSP